VDFAILVNPQKKEQKRKKVSTNTNETVKEGKGSNCYTVVAPAFTWLSCFNILTRLGLQVVFKKQACTQVGHSFRSL
jgi:hypothetical protein